MTLNRLSRLVIASALPLLLAQSADSVASFTTPGQTLGYVHFPISCSPSAQRNFDQALALLHSFFFPNAGDAFAAIVKVEPSCAMAYWGVAISERLNPLAAPTPRPALKRGSDAIEQAQAASFGATPRERAWIDALGAFFKDYDTVDQKTRTLRYEEKMAQLHARFPSDVEAAIFYALALDGAADPADKTYARQLMAAAILEELEPLYPNHPGIPHYIIHSYDYPALAQRGLFAAVRCVQIAPAAPHALHMPSHIFSMLGMWHDVIRADLTADTAVKAMALDRYPLAGATQAANGGRYHSLDFLTNAYLQLGQDRRAEEIVKMRNKVADVFQTTQFTAHTAFAAIPVRYAFERGAWGEAAALPVLRTPYPQAEAISWFGRAIGAARSGDLVGAEADLDHLHALKAKLAESGDAYWTQQVEIQETAAAAWMALRSGHKDKAIVQMRQAADIEDKTEKHIAMENRLSPMRELLGELLLEADEPALAIQEFEAALRTTPNRYRSIAGAMKAAERLGDGAARQRYSEMLVDLGNSADTERPDLLKARQYLATR
jgi:hypothetical protein